MAFEGENRTRPLRLVGELSVVGLTLVIATAIGYFLGVWIGGHLGSSVWGGVVGALIGVIAGFVEMFRTVNRYMRQLGEEQEQGRTDG